MLGAASGLPRYGVMMNDSSLLEMVDCDEFLNMGVRYRHTADTNSPDRDYIPLVVEIMDPSGSMLKQEYFQVRARLGWGETGDEKGVGVGSGMGVGFAVWMDARAR